MFDNDGHFIDDPLAIVNAKPDFEGIGYASTADNNKELYDTTD